MFRILEFGQFLTDHHINVKRSLETMKAGTTALTTKIEPGGQRGGILKILAPQAEQNGQSVQATTQVNEAKEQ